MKKWGFNDAIYVFECEEDINPRQDFLRLWEKKMTSVKMKAHLRILTLIRQPSFLQRSDLALKTRVIFVI